MGSTAHVIGVGSRHPEDLVTLAHRRLDDLETHWSRFRDSSVVSELNRSGDAIVVDEDTLSLVLRSRDAWRLTDGLFDPTVLASLVLAGYRHGLDETGHGGDPGGGDIGPAPGFHRVKIDPRTATIHLPDGVEFDPGGIGKGLAADIVAAEMSEAGADGALVNVGGDLCVVGTPAAASKWVVSIEDPFDESKSIAQLCLSEGGIATTTPAHRRWRIGDRPGVHIIDPRTGRQATTDVASVTVLAAQTWMAEAVTKAVAVAGSAEGINIIEAVGLAGIIVTTDGRTCLSARIGAFL